MEEEHREVFVQPRGKKCKWFRSLRLQCGLALKVNSTGQHYTFKVFESIRPIWQVRGEPRSEVHLTK